MKGRYYISYNGKIFPKEIKERINQIHYTVDFLKECYIDTITGANKI